MMEELTQKLADLETRWREVLDEADVATAEEDAKLDELHAQIADIQKRTSIIQKPYVQRTNLLMDAIKAVRAQIMLEVGDANLSAELKANKDAPVRDFKAVCEELGV